MSDTTKEAIKSAYERLENEKVEQVKAEVYNFLKSELSSIESIDKRIRDLSEQKRIHEENIKNVKTGNLEAVEKRRLALNSQWQPFTFTNNTSWSGHKFFNDFVAGTVVDVNGKRFIF